MSYLDSTIHPPICDSSQVLVLVSNTSDVPKIKSQISCLENPPRLRFLLALHVSAEDLAVWVRIQLIRGF